jgi:hypothetical protein
MFVESLERRIITSAMPSTDPCCERSKLRVGIVPRNGRTQPIGPRTLGALSAGDIPTESAKEFGIPREAKAVEKHDR